MPLFRARLILGRRVIPRVPHKGHGHPIAHHLGLDIDAIRPAQRRFRKVLGAKAAARGNADVTHDLAILDREIAYLERFVAKLKRSIKYGSVSDLSAYQPAGPVLPEPETVPEG
jgi:hypothetical protein